MNELALFAGAGGGILGSILLGHRIVCAVEIEPYCREVLLRRQGDGVLPLFPVWDDISSFDGSPWRGAVDLVSAGFPCQPFSAAGRRRGEKDDRNLWPDTIRVIREVGPRFAFLENVPNLLAYDYFGEIIGSLAESGFDAEWGIVSAAEVGAPHLRKRLWIVAHAQRPKLWDKSGRRSRQNRTGEGIVGPDGQDGALAHAAIEPKRESAITSFAESTGRVAREVLGGGGWWTTEPRLGRVAHVVAHRMDRLKALGNGQVPRVAEHAWNWLSNGA